MTLAAIGPSRIEYMPIMDLVFDPANAKNHDDEGLDRSLNQFGFIEPVIYDERTGMLLAGHGRVGRLRAWKEEGRPPPEGIILNDVGEWCVEVVRGKRSKDGDHARALLVALNRLTETGGWDQRRLVGLLDDLPRTELPLLDATGFTLADLQLMKLELDSHSYNRDRDPDAIPEVKEATTKPGDLWVLGAHQLLCGDARERSAYDRLLIDENPDRVLLLTDPPYGVGIGAKNRALDSVDRAGRVLTDLNGDLGLEEVEKLWRSSFAVLHGVLAPGTAYYIFGPQGGELGLLWLLVLREAGLAPRHILIWKKNRPSFSIGRLDYDYQHEPIVYGWKPGAAHRWHADGARASILEFDRPQASPDHPTAKPVALLSALIGNSSAAGDLVLDPFAGSGSTMVAALRTQRRSALIEVDPLYCDVICRRYEAETGATAVLADA
jgi:DNA modification methylase